MSGGVRTVERWRRNQRAIAPADAFVAELPPFRTRSAALVDEVGALAAGSAVIVCAPPPFARRRCRRLASVAAIDIECEYVALPTPRAPAYLVEDSPAATAYFLRSILVPPPGRLWTAPFRLCVAVVCRFPNPGRIVGLVAPRLVVGTRR